jgi:hypothetical protein
MTPIEKANELYDKYWRIDGGDGIQIGIMSRQMAIKCAVIHVNGILDAFESDDKAHKDCHYINSPIYRFFEQVKQELKSYETNS